MLDQTTYCYENYCSMGTLHLPQQLPMVLFGPIAFAAAVADYFARAHSFFCELSPMVSFGLIAFLGATANTLTQAHCI